MDLERAEMTDRQKFSIGIVDDNAVNVMLLERALIKCGYEVFSAENGLQAKQMAAENRPDLILLDIMLPGEDGFEVIRQLKGSSMTAHIPILFLTSRNELELKMNGFELGAVDYITKPFHVQEVIARVRLHLRLALATNSLIQSQADKLRQIRDAQSSMLLNPEDLPQARFGISYISKLEAGGDFYDVMTISEDIFGYFVGDLSGHDIATGYMTAAVKALLKQNCILVYEPLESMRLINDVLVEILSDGKYMTAAYAVMNRKTLKMTLVNAGHLPVLYHPKGESPRFIRVSGDVLGAFKNVSFGAQEIDVRPGDRFYLFSDGLIESVEEKKIWTTQLEQLRSACEKIKTVPLQESPEKLAGMMLKNRKALSDDVVVLAIEV